LAFSRLVAENRNAQGFVGFCKCAVVSTFGFRPSHCKR